MKVNIFSKSGKNNVVIALVAAVLLIGLFVVLRSANSEAPAAVREFNLQIQNGKLTDDIDALAAYEGQTLICNVTSDSDDEFHIHGYDVKAELEAGKASQFEFKADKTGRFEVEAHKAGQQLTVLEVKPNP